MKRLSHRLILILMLIVVASVAACTDSGPDVAPTPTPTPTPEPPTPLEQLGEVATAMQALESVRFALSRSGAPVSLALSDELTVAFNAAYGRFVAPDRVAARANVGAMGVVLEVETVAIGERQWLTDPLTQSWTELPAALAFNPGILFDEAEGWTTILDENVDDVVDGGSDEVNGQSYDVLIVTLSGDRVRTVTGGLTSDDAVEMRLFYDPETNLIAQMRFDTGEGETLTSWTLVFDQYNATAVIEPPTEGSDAELDADT